MSEQDVENYKQIKSDLDQLRLTVEKSELWVEKSIVYTGEELAAKMAKEPNIEVLCSYLKVKHLEAASKSNVLHFRVGYDIFSSLRNDCLC